ncbi:hypothetical protein GCM10009662_05650 [Catellatospora coxensis]|uniref:Uncharacterized protein n=1 Tax=Catellatospora coxensis TaxID=310354 RepID=A0A8J3KQV5_9ACTN|nr:hypothetical protein Cco03nite_22250 [Catellatospora coxensis]
MDDPLEYLREGALNQAFQAFLEALQHAHRSSSGSEDMMLSALHSRVFAQYVRRCRRHASMTTILASDFTLGQVVVLVFSPQRPPG